MKTYLNIFIGILSLAIFACNDKKTKTVTTTTTTVTKEKCNSADSTAVGDTDRNVSGTTATYTSNTSVSNTSTSKQRSTTQNNGSSGSAATENSKTTTRQKKNLDGYSAPDGTDAENHDGDEYTKNDNRVMPSAGGFK